MLTPGRVVILRTMLEKPQSWSSLRLAYYGPGRAAHKASTSFVNQLSRMLELGLIMKTVEGYDLTPQGRFLLKGEMNKGDVNGVKTEAQRDFEVSCPHTLVNASGKCLSCGK